MTRAIVIIYTAHPLPLCLNAAQEVERCARPQLHRRRECLPMPWRCSTISEGALEPFACHPGASTEWWTRDDWRVRQNQVRSVGRCCRSRGVCPLTVSHGGVQ